MPSVVVQARVDAIVLASLMNFYESKGVVIKTKSQLLKMISEDFFAICKRCDNLKPLTKYEADLYLRKINAKLLEEDGRKSILDNIISSLSKDESLHDDLQKLKESEERSKVDDSNISEYLPKISNKKKKGD